MNQSKQSLRIIKRITMSPAVNISGFAGDRVVEFVSEEDSSVGDSNKILIEDLYFLFSIVVVKL